MKGPAPTYCSNSHRQRAHEGRQLARMAGVAEVMRAVKTPPALAEMSRAVETLRIAEAFPATSALTEASRALTNFNTAGILGKPPYQDLFKNIAASTHVTDMLGSFAAAKAPLAIAESNVPNIAGMFEPAILDQFRSMSNMPTTTLASHLADINGQRGLLAALGTIQSVSLVKNLVPEAGWIKAFEASGPSNALLAGAVGGLPNLAAEIASTTTKLFTIDLPKQNWFEDIDLGINSWSQLVRMMPPQPSPSQLGALSVMGSGALSVAESGLILSDDEFEAEMSTPDPFASQREGFRLRLKELGADPIQRIDGAWERINRPGPDAASQAAHSLVEFVDWTLRLAAPDTTVLAWHAETQRPSNELRNGRPDRALKIRYLMRNRPNEAESTEMQIRSLTGIMACLQKQKHSPGDKERRAVERLIPTVESVIYFVLP